MLRRVNNPNAGWLWMSAIFLLLILGSNHLYGYSLLDSILEHIGVGSWTKEGQLGWHISSLITLPLLLLCIIQSVRSLKDRYPHITIILMVCIAIFIGIYPEVTERLVSIVLSQ